MLSVRAAFGSQAFRCDQATTHAANTDINLAEQEPVPGLVNELDEEQHVEESFGDQASAVSAGYHPEEVPLCAVVNPSHQAVTRPEAREAPAHQQPVECEIEVEIEHVGDNYQEIAECNLQSGREHYQQGAANIPQLAVYSPESLDTPRCPVPEWTSYSPPLYKVRLLGRPGQKLYPGRTSSGQEYIFWEINDFPMHLQDTVDGNIEAVESPVMKMGRYGYSYRILIFPKGTNGEDGNHMSVFVSMMPAGEENVNLRWPFRGLFIITLMDQSGNANPQNHSCTIQTIDNLRAFQMPSDARQYAWLYGYAKFARTDEVCSPWYCRDGRVTFKVKVIPRT